MTSIPTGKYSSSLPSAALTPGRSRGLPAPQAPSTVRAPAPIVRERPNQSIATAQGPKQLQGQAQVRADIFTYLTKSDGKTYILYNGDRNWVTIELLLETGGPVVVGNKSDLAPLQSGKGILLQTGKKRELEVAKGTRIYIAATAVSRVSVSIQPKPWLEQITAGVDNITAATAAIATKD